MTKLEQKYRRLYLRKRLRSEAAMKSAFIRVAKEFTQHFGNNPIVRNNEGFLFAKNEPLNVELTKFVKGFETDLFKITTSGISDAWSTANEMNDELVTYYFKGWCYYFKIFT